MYCIATELFKGQRFCFSIFVDESAKISRISRKFDMELNLVVGDFLWSLPNLIHVFWIILKIILGSWEIIKFNSLNEFIFQIAVFSSQIFCLYSILKKFIMHWIIHPKNHDLYNNYMTIYFGKIYLFYTFYMVELQKNLIATFEYLLLLCSYSQVDVSFGYQVVKF